MVVLRIVNAMVPLVGAIAETHEATGLLQSTRTLVVVPEGDLTLPEDAQTTGDAGLSSDDEEALEFDDVDEDYSDDYDDLEPDYEGMEVDDLVKIYDWKYGHLNEFLEPPSVSNESTFTMKIPAAVAKTDAAAFIMSELGHDELRKYDLSTLDINCDDGVEMQSVSPECSATFAHKSFDQVLMQFEAEKAKRKKNKKQKNWAAKMLARMEKEVCLRNKRAMKHATVGHGQSCPPGTNGIWAVAGKVCRGCEGWTEGAGECFEPCTEARGFPHMPLDCLHLYCAADQGTCNARVGKIAMSFADVVSNFIPGAQAMKAVKMAAKATSKLAAKKIFVTLVRKSARRMLKRLSAKNMKKRLKKYMKKELKKKLKELKKEAREEETVNAILEGGAAELIAQAEAQANPDLAAIAMDALETVDPTGIVGFINAFSAQDCNDARVNEEMPADGLEDETVYWSGDYNEHCTGQKGQYCPESYCYDDLDCASRTCHMVSTLGGRGVCAGSDGYLTIRSPCSSDDQCSSDYCEKQTYTMSFCAHKTPSNYCMAKDKTPSSCHTAYGQYAVQAELKNAVPDSCPSKEVNCAITDSITCGLECDKWSSCNSFMMTKKHNTASDDSRSLSSCIMCYKNGLSRKHNEGYDTFYKCR